MMTGLSFLLLLGCGSGALQQTIITPAISAVLPGTTAVSASNTLRVTGIGSSQQPSIKWSDSAPPTSVINVNALQSTMASSSPVTPATAHLRVKNPPDNNKSQPAPTLIARVSTPNLTTSSDGSSFAMSGDPTTPLVITTSALPAGTVGLAYATTLAVTGGTAPYMWTVTSGTPPIGLMLSSSGVLAGMPTTMGSYTFAVTVTDANGETSSTTLRLPIAAGGSPLVITNMGLPNAKQGRIYVASLQVTGGTPPYVWQIASGSLPNYVRMNLQGGIIGLPITIGTTSATYQVKDSAGHTALATFSLTVASPPLSITSTELPSAVVASPYIAFLRAIGGRLPFQWSISAGSLPAGITLNSSTGVLLGTPTSSGLSTFTVTVRDSSNPVQTASVPLNIQVTTSVLSVTTTAIPPATISTPYSVTLQAIGGRSPYGWSIASGSLPTGITLAADGTLSGTPAVTGTFPITVYVHDSAVPDQHTTQWLNLVVGDGTLFNTWYVRPDGGTRYDSITVPTGQCDGLGDAAYPGQGTNQHCAFNDVRYLWTDGVTYCTDSSSTSTCWTWVGRGGDTYIIRGSIDDGVSYRIGQSGPESNEYFGLPGDPYAAGMPPPHSGTAVAHTRVLGENYAACSSQTARTQLNGGYGVSGVVHLEGASYVDMACLDITDFSACGRGGQLNGCNTNFPLSDYANTGLDWSNQSTHDTVTEVRLHGLASLGMFGPTGDGVIMTNIAIVGNASGGWNADAGDGLTGVGSLLVQNFQISWNGCAEEYPMVDPLPYQDCTDENEGGYGDGFGTATTPSLAPGWQAHFDQGVVSFNTQDGLDALHLNGPGSSMTITRVLADSNMGQQIKIGGAAGTAANNLIVTNCNAMRQDIPGTPSGYNSRLQAFCRAADTGIVMTLGNGSLLTFDYNTIYSAAATGVEIECDSGNGACGATSLIDFRDNIFLGFQNDNANGYTNGGTGNYSNPIYLGTINPFLNAGSHYSHNLTFHANSSWQCPQTAWDEMNALCVDPQLTDETWHLYGAGNMKPQPSIRVVQGAGTPVPGITMDFTGQTRPNPPSIGAYEQ